MRGLWQVGLPFVEAWLVEANIASETHTRYNEDIPVGFDFPNPPCILNDLLQLHLLARMSLLIRTKRRATLRG